jgi:hypothetical protein
MADAVEVECAKLEEFNDNRGSATAELACKLHFSTVLPSISLLGRVEAIIELYTDYTGHWRISKSPYIMEDEAKFPS